MNRPRVLIPLGVAGLIGTLLWGAWVFDPSSAHQRAEQKPEGEFTYKLPEDQNQAHRDVLIGCNEEAMEKPLAEFAKWKGLSGIPLSFPGGPLAVARLNNVSAGGNLKALQRSAIEVLKRYSPKRIVLVGHDRCLYYDTAAAWNNSPGSVRGEQINDMRAARELLREWFPQAEITTFMAEEESRTLFFRPVN